MGCMTIRLNDISWSASHFLTYNVLYNGYWPGLIPFCKMRDISTVSVANSKIYSAESSGTTNK